MSGSDVTTMAGGALWTCQICADRHAERGSGRRYTFVSELALTMHADSKHAHACRICEKSLGTSDALANHMAAKHRDIEELINAVQDALSPSPREDWLARLRTALSAWRSS